MSITQPVLSCLKSTKKTTKLRHWRRSGVFFLILSRFHAVICYFLCWLWKINFQRSETNCHLTLFFAHHCNIYLKRLLSNSLEISSFFWKIVPWCTFRGFKSTKISHKALNLIGWFKPLTHYFPMHPFSNPWKHQKTVRFSDVFKE